MNNLLLKFIEFALGNGIALILGFISSPIITRLVIPEEFGKFSMFNTVTNLLLIIVMLGLDQSYVRFFYEEKEEDRGKLLRKTIKYPLIANIILSILLVIFYKPMSEVIVGKYSFFVIVLLIIQNTFSLINRFACLIIRMEQKGKVYSLIQVLTKLFYIIFVLLLFKIFNRDYRTLVVAITLATVITTIMAVMVEKRQWFSFQQNDKLKTSTKELFLFGMPLILSTAITWIFQSTDRFFISAYSGYTELGIYSSAFSIVALLNAVQGTFTTFWVPVANEKYQENPNDTKFFEDINAIISLVMLIIATLLITSKDLLVLLLGSKYRDASFIFPFLVFMPIMYTISETTVLGINFKKKTKYHIWIAVISAITNFIGNYLLVPSMGAKGAAISTGLSYVVFFAIRTIISKRLYNVNYNLRRFSICTIFMIILSIYASLYEFNIILPILGLITLIVILISYKFTIIKYWKQVKYKFKK